MTAGAPIIKNDMLLTFTGISLVMFLAVMDMAAIPIALPAIGTALDGMKDLAWVMTSYMLTSTATAPIYGKLSDLFGRRRVLQAAIILFLAGAVMCAGATSITQLICYRIIQGLGGGGLIVLAFIIIGEIIVPREQGRYQGYMGGIFALSSILGPVIGGLLIEATSWRWIFMLYVPIGILALYLTRRAPGAQPARAGKPKLDVLGAILLMAGITLILLFINRFSAMKNGTFAVSSEFLMLGAGVLAVLILFLTQERRAPEPILPLTMFDNSVFSIAVSVVAISSMSMFAATIFLPQYFQIVLGAGPTEAGMLLVPFKIGMMVAPIGGGWLLSRTGHYKPYLVVGLGLAALMYVILGLVDGVLTNHLLAPIVLSCLGLGLGVAMPLMTVAVQNAVERRHLGTATAMLGFFRSLGGVVGVAVFGAIYSANIMQRLDRIPLPGTSAQAVVDGGAVAFAKLSRTQLESVLAAFSDSFLAVLLVAAAIAILACLLALSIKECIPVAE